MYTRVQLACLHTALSAACFQHQTACTKGDHMRNSIMLCALAFLLSNTGCMFFSTPGSTTEIPQPTAIALATGSTFADIVDMLPAEAWAADAQMLTIDQEWFDRQWALQVDSDADGHFVDIISESSAGTALEARKSDNDRSVQNVDAVTGILGNALAAYLGGGAGGAAGMLGGMQPPARVPEDLALVQARMATLEQTMAEILAAVSDPAPVVDTGG